MQRQHSCLADVFRVAAAILFLQISFYIGFLSTFRLGFFLCSHYREQGVGREHDARGQAIRAARSR